MSEAWLERAAGALLPPSARESVLGDFRERNQTSTRYFMDAARAIPLVILSRMRRTTDPETLLTETLGLYLAWCLAAWISSDALTQTWGLLLLAGPAAVAMFSMMLGDAWTARGYRRPAIGRAIHGGGWALVSQVIFALCPVHLPLVTVLVGLGLSLFVSAAVGWISPAVPGAPMAWEDQVIRITEIVVGVISLSAAVAWVAPLALVALA